MTRHSQIAAVILAGGASARMGKDKGLLKLLGDPIIVRTASVVEPLVASVTIIGEPEKYGPLGIPVIPDRTFRPKGVREHKFGPLAGIATALSASSKPWNLILACDLPYLTTEWLAWLISKGVESRAQVVLPRTSGGLEPLAAIYRKECFAPIIAALERGVRKVTDGLAELTVEVVPERDWRHLDPDGVVLHNMNELEEYDAAVKWYAGRSLALIRQAEADTPSRSTPE
jgi:molybdopterin-guanine dinucleotide biosynthesis protein A